MRFWPRSTTASTSRRVVAITAATVGLCALAACSSSGPPAAEGSHVVAVAGSANATNSAAAAQAWYTNKVQSYLGSVTPNLADLSVSSIKQAAGLTGSATNCTIPKAAADWFTANPPPAGAADLTQSWSALTAVLADASQACTSGNSAQLAKDVASFLTELQKLATTLQQDGILPK